jgi:chemotaxis signal transduction protein
MSTEREKSYVLFPMGPRRFALPAEKVTELARPDRLQTFPHGTPLLAGVLVRRGRIVPVYDVAQHLVGPEAPPRRFYLIANRQIDAHHEWTAITVTGECELASVKVSDFVAEAKEDQPPYICGSIAVGGAYVDVVDLEKLISMEEAR